MSRASELAAARAHAANLSAERAAPGLGEPQSGVPDSEQAAKELQALGQLGAHVVDDGVGLTKASHVPPQTPPMPAVSAPQAPVENMSEAEAEETDATPPDPIEVLSSMPGGPSKELLHRLKLEWPEVFFLPLRDEEVYVYRYLNNLEWRTQILTQTQLVQNEEALKDAVVQRCVLWPRLSPQQWAAKQAGLRDLLYEVVMKSSYFIEPEQAMALVMRL